MRVHNHELALVPVGAEAPELQPVRHLVDVILELRVHCGNIDCVPSAANARPSAYPSGTFDSAGRASTLRSRLSMKMLKSGQWIALPYTLRDVKYSYSCSPTQTRDCVPLIIPHSSRASVPRTPASSSLYMSPLRHTEAYALLRSCCSTYSGKPRARAAHAREGVDLVVYRATRAECRL